MAARERLARLRSNAAEDETPTPVVLLAAAVAAAVLSPVAWLVWRASKIGVGEAIGLLTSPTATEVLINSLILTATVTGASIVLGVPLAVLTVQTDLPFRRFWTVLIALPL